jgi:hypothetical protein
VSKSAQPGQRRILPFTQTRNNPMDQTIQAVRGFGCADTRSARHFMRDIKLLHRFNCTNGVPKRAVRSPVDPIQPIENKSIPPPVKVLD